MLMKIVRIIRSRSALQEREHLILRQNRWQCVLGTGIRDLLGQRLVAERRAVEEAQSSDDWIDRARLQPTRQQMPPVVSDLLDAELIGRCVMVAGEAGDGVGVALLGPPTCCGRPCHRACAA